MGRSVAVPRNAVATVYIPAEPDQFDDYMDWADFLDDIRAVVRGKYPSMDNADRWLEREEHVIAENAHGDVVLCEYCGMVSVSLVPTEAGYPYESEQNLHDGWCRQVEDGFRGALNTAFGGYVRTGTMSNGVSVYQKAGV